MPVNALSVVSELAASQHNVFTRQQAAPHGVDRKHIQRLITAGVVAPLPGGGLVLLPGPGGPTWLQHATGAALAHPGSVASHSTSARLDGVDGYGGFASIDLTVVRPNTLRSPGVTTHRVHTLDRCDVLMIGPVPCTNRARTLCDLAGVVTADMLERALDDAVRRGSNPRWIRATAERLRERGRTGPVQLLRALDAMEQRGRVRDSWFEKLVEQCLDDPVIGEVSRQFQLNDGDGRHVARFDLAVPEVKLGIEAHSRRHHFTKEEEASDEHRDHAASVLGWDVMYLGYSAVQSPATVAAAVRARVEARRSAGSGHG